MKDKFKNVVLLLSAAIVLVAVVFVILNWPSIWRRVSFLGDKSNDLDNGQVAAMERTEQIQSLVMADNINFPELFVGDDVIRVKKEYENMYSDNYLVIPSLGIKTPIVYLDDVSDSVLQEKLKQGVGHYPDTAMPGETGNSFLFGHSSYYWWDWSEYNSIFANLESIEEGALVLVYYNSELFVYRVDSTKVVAPADLSVLEQSNKRELSLMTCTPLGTNINRFVVKAHLIS